MDVMMRRRELMGMQGKLKTVTGSIVTVNDALARNAKSLIVNFAPVQAAGTPSPDNVLPISGWTGVTGYRTGANVWDEEWESGRFDTATGTPISDSNAIKSKNYISVVPNTQYHFTILSNTSIWAMFFDSDKNIITTGLPSTSTSYNCRAVGNYTIKMPANCYYIKFYANAYGSTYANNISVNYPATDTAYHPYTGTTYPVTFPAVGKNLFDNAFYATNDAYTITGSYAYKYTDYIQLAPNTEYVIKPNSSGTLTKLGNYVVLGTGSAKYVVHNYQYGQAITFTTGADGMIRFGVHVPSGATRPEALEEMFTAMQIQLEKGSTATTYEPYTNIIYGGYVDLVSGVLVATWAGIDMGEMPWDYYTGSTLKFFFAVIDDVLTYSANNSLCSVYKYASSISVNNNSFQFNGKQLRIRSDSYSDKSDFKSALSGQIFVYPLATPITYQLTPQTIAMLKGTNNVWANANGNTELTYYAQ